MTDIPAARTTPQQVIARDVVADGDPRGEVVADRILAALKAAGFVVLAEADVRAFAMETIYNFRGAAEELRMADRRAEEHLAMLLGAEAADGR